MVEAEGLVMVIPEGYPYVMLMGVLLCIECSVFSYWTISARRRIFSREWLAENFEEEHIQAMSPELTEKNQRPPSEISTGGFPDNGDGRYSEKLTYKDWFVFS